jgi:hypothetical protein
VLQQQCAWQHMKQAWGERSVRFKVCTAFDCVRLALLCLLCYGSSSVHSST